MIAPAPGGWEGTRGRWLMRVCGDESLLILGRLVRRLAPPVVAASTVGAWHWCRLKAWHVTTLFNAGWLDLSSLTPGLLRGLAILWAAEFAKNSLIRVIRGRIIHGEYVEPMEAVEAAEHARALASPQGGEELLRLIRSGVVAGPGLIDPEALRLQLRRYAEASDLVSYHRREEWPLIAREADSFLLIGVPDSIEETTGGIRVVEVKTTSRPQSMRQHLRGYRAAKTQLAAYTWILIERWPIEEAVLIVKASDGSTVMVERFDPEDLAAWFEEHGLPKARQLASPEPPEPQRKPPCRSCEYGGKWPHVYGAASPASPER